MMEPRAVRARIVSAKASKVLWAWLSAESHQALSNSKIMQDPSTPSPSDPEKSDPGSPPSEKSPKIPIKLKPLGKPESPPAPELPPVSDPPVSDPPAEPKVESDLDKKRNALKLRRMVIKDVEINPHKNPEAEPTPEAQPYQEPEEAPPPADLKSVMEAPPPPEDIPPEEPPKPEVEEPQEAPQPEAKTLAGQKPAPLEPPKTEEAEPKKISTARKLIAGFAFTAVFALAGMLAIAYFKPFGKNLAPIEHNRLPGPTQ